ncbi:MULTISPECIES: hypothetical protein [Bacillus cereus group]|uniref:hypothetical protein n=1 Tax=Bacillus cereus group TaxID=86661 RepID=UPI0021014ED5|nr:MULTISPECIES: hypothetical protein [Bacillus cereus group]
MNNESLTEENTDIYRDLEDIVSALKMAKEENINVNLLIGAGCSVTANIPAAQGMIDTIKEKYPREFKRAKIKDYPNCMSKLTPSERKNLISQIIKDAKINWTHIAIAQLLKNGYINRILTPNFDNLVQRACSLVGEFPAIYDLTTSSEFRTDLLFDKSVIHLHGQHTGFILCNTEKEVEAQSQVLKPIFEQLDRKSLWIVVGYSGNNDPIFKLLARKEVFEHRLFWIGYEDYEPSTMLKENLLLDGKYAFFTKGFNSDDFFVSVAQQLKCFPPAFVQKPFTYLSETLDTLAEYKVPSIRNDLSKNNDLNESNNLHILTKNVVEKAIETIESDYTLMAQHYFMAGLFDEVIQLANEKNDEDNFEFEYQVINAFSHRNKGNDLLIALERLNKLDSKFPGKVQIKKDLSDLYFSAGLKDILQNSEEFSLENQKLLSLSIENLEKTYDLIPSAINFFRWELYLTFLYKVLFFKNNQDFNKLLQTSLTTLLAKLQNTTFDVLDSKIHEIASLSIEHQNFEFATFILDELNKLDKLDKSCQAYIAATRGLWFFRNKNISPDVALQTGLNYYKEGLEFLEKEENFDTSQHKYIGLKQHFLFEHAMFLLLHKKDTEIAIANLNKCVDLGEINGVYSEIRKEAIDFLESLKPQNVTAAQVASTI